MERNPCLAGLLLCSNGKCCLATFVCRLTCGETDIRFFPEATIDAVTVSSSTRQLPSPVTVTVTSLLCFLLSVSEVGDTDIELASHTGMFVGEGITTGVAVGVLVGVTDVVIAGVGVGILVMVKLESGTLDDPS